VIDGEEYRHDITIGLNGVVRKRRKKLSKEKFGTSHKISREEAEDIYEPHAERLIIGSGMFDRVHLSGGARKFFEDAGCEVDLHPTGKAAKVWNKAEGRVLALFHITC